VAGQALVLDAAIVEALDVAAAGIELFTGAPASSASVTNAMPLLPDGVTVREAEVLALIAAGYTNRQIAGALVVSDGTVERHISNLYAKMGARGRADATAYALRHGLARD
jgi:DNA-binding NarL/FixJ family response regulator